MWISKIRPQSLRWYKPDQVQRVGLRPLSQHFRVAPR